MKKLLICHIAFLFYVLHIASAEDNSLPEKRVYTTQRLSEESNLIIDGLLNDDAWEDLPWGSNFTQRYPNGGESPSMETAFKITYDDRFLYVGFRCYDSEPDKIVKRLSRRDGFEGDWVEINIDSYFDLQTAFSFTITAAGVKGDEFVSIDGSNWDASWNPIWVAKSQVDDQGWTAEMKIPFNQLRFAKIDEPIWGLQINRRFFRNEEQSNWQYVPQDAAGWVSKFGELHGLKAINPKKQIELQPYGLAQLSVYEAEEGNPFRDGSDMKFSGGLDGKIGITNDITLDFTVNPDFGQVEADPAAIALDGFQIFFREQRPFFIENANIFNYSVSPSQAGNTFGNDNLFYSRRIGRNPSRYPDLGNDEYSSQPGNTTILGAAKMSGKTQKGLSVGILESVTGKEFAQVEGKDDSRKELVEPLTNYFVARMKQDFNERNSTIGAILTSTIRDIDGDLNFLHTSATTGGFDFLHQWKDRSWYVSGNVVISHVSGSKEALLNTQQSISHLFNRVDADYLSVDSNRTGLTGDGGNLKIGKIGSGDFIFETGFTWRSPSLELNDVGFQRLSDDLRHYAWMGYRWRKPFSIFRQAGVNYNHWLAYDYGGHLKQVLWNINGDMTFKNNWGIGLGTSIVPFDYSNAELRGGPRYRYLPKTGGWVWGNTDFRKKFGLEYNFNFDRVREDAAAYTGYSLWMRYQPINAINMSIGPNYSIYQNQLQYVNQVEFENDTRYLVGEIEQKTLGMSVRLNYTINPNLTLQFYGEPFISTGRYKDFKYITDPLAGNLKDKSYLFQDSQISYDPEHATYSITEDIDGEIDYSFSNPDFTYVQYRSNFVLRWEYVPGSELFFVWTQNNTNSENSNSNNLFTILNENLIGVPSEHIFLVKLTYRWGI